MEQSILYTLLVVLVIIVIAVVVLRAFGEEAAVLRAENTNMSLVLEGSSNITFVPVTVDNKTTPAVNETTVDKPIIVDGDGQ